METSAIVHVHGGSVLLEHLSAAAVPGATLEWCDPVCGGPTPAPATADEWYRVRADYLASGPGAPAASAIEQRLRDQDRALAAIPANAEVVIWAGPELFCQAILMRLLVLLGQRPSGRLSLVDPGDQPGSPGCGLGHLDAAALMAAFQARRPASADAIALARRAWAAFTAPTAAPLVTLVASDTRALPHLKPALQRHLGDLPDGGTGLSTTETNLFETLRQGPRELGALMQALAAREARPWLTDTLLAEILRRLAGTEAPLVTVDGTKVSITQRGDDVLAGYEVWYAERWHGGIFIGPDDEHAEPTD
jgi:hypothetical protein